MTICAKNALHISPLNCIDLSETWTAKKNKAGKKAELSKPDFKNCPQLFSYSFQFCGKIRRKKKGEKYFFLLKFLGAGLTGDLSLVSKVTI